MKTDYNTHCHIFNLDVIIRRFVYLKSLFTEDLPDTGISCDNLKYKTDGNNKTLTDAAQNTGEDVFRTIDKGYLEDIIITPLMFNSTYADNNNKLIFSIIENLLTYKNSILDKLFDFEKLKPIYGSGFFSARFFEATKKWYFSGFKAAFANDFELIFSVNFPTIFK